ncbi:lactococcin 972 family bacteriocin [Staphylococcus aureus]|mgnify:CR=1 FL=1|uniref:lactococcin 972 family bacteriocin n=1 Tax=Staphylococcus warneri TaxID=1292 RepID=UPI002928ABB6|nr:lactococcin 972 family bacteriocin [Staphylococcus warneri]MDU9352108.1 lactococcin 972 family bacteriocin [Staphylococcus warneri]
MKNKVLGLSLYLSLALGISTVTYATAYEYAHGGTWSHGVGSKYVWSYYYHSSKGHGSTAIGKYESYSGYTRPGIKAKASATKTFWGINKAYYNVY